MKSVSPTSVDEYFAGFPADVQLIMHKIRGIIKKIVPEAEESISYGMPAYKYHKPLVYFAAFKNHIGLYALPSGNEAFKDELKKYKTGRGSIQFPLNNPIPYDLIEKIVIFRVEENKAKLQKLKK